MNAEAETYASLAMEVLKRPPLLGGVRLVAVDGGSGAGKTAFAYRLATALQAAGATTELVHTDDLLAGWSDQFTFWPRLEEGILGPLREGRDGGYRRYDWRVASFAEQHTVPVPEVLIIEGSTAARLAINAELSLSIFLVADPDARLARALSRDGAGIEADLRRWMAAEDAHFAREATLGRADVLVDGEPQVGHDPDIEYVRLR
jgi:hypothetical protein